MSIRALIVDDNPINNLILEDILSDLGIDVVVESSVVSAISTFNNSSFNIVITDIVLPSESGYDLAMHVQSNSNGKIPIISSSIEPIENRYEELFSGSITKPFEREHIAQLLTELQLSSQEFENLPPTATQIINEYAPELISIAKQDASKLKALVRSNDISMSKRALHQLKGAISTIAPDSYAIHHIEKIDQLLTENSIVQSSVIRDIERMIDEITDTLSSALATEKQDS
ncbi:response regulator [Vibrio mediterranei]|uniref:response regulator n=1 Tax=Vibrio mediterranei TaxID=689 RepID=UPI00148C31FC|nr:response regulator [Vibrio mediterranei]NOI23441.1 response regulator [Vibrio mediterranei]